MPDPVVLAQPDAQRHDLPHDSEDQVSGGDIIIGTYRLLTVFEAPDRCILLLVAEHTRTANPYSCWSTNRTHGGPSPVASGSIACCGAASSRELCLARRVLCPGGVPSCGCSLGPQRLHRSVAADNENPGRQNQGTKRRTGAVPGFNPDLPGQRGRELLGVATTFLRVVRRVPGVTVAVHDAPENILERITFYDIDSRRMEKHLTEEERILYLKEIKADISYFKRSYERADLQVTITGLDPEASAAAIDARLGHT